MLSCGPILNVRTAKIRWTASFYSFIGFPQWVTATCEPSGTSSVATALPQSLTKAECNVI